MISVFQEVFAQQDHQALLPIARAFVREDHYPRLGEIQVPTVVIVGAADRTTPRGHAERLAAGVPGARLITSSGRPLAELGSRWPRRFTRNHRIISAEIRGPLAHPASVTRAVEGKRAKQIDRLSRTPRFRVRPRP